jgi:hypothetical protein
MYVSPTIQTLGEYDDLERGWVNCVAVAAIAAVAIAVPPAVAVAVAGAVAPAYAWCLSAE